MSLFEAAYKHISWYRENQNRLFDIQDMELRGKINRLMNTNMYLLDNAYENSSNAKDTLRALEDGSKLSEKDRKILMDEFAKDTAGRELYLKQQKYYLGKLRELYPALEALAKARFDVKLDVEAGIDPERMENPTTMSGKPIQQDDASET